VIVFPAVDVGEIEVVNDDITARVWEQISKDRKSLFAFRLPLVVPEIVLLAKRRKITITSPNNLLNTGDVCFVNEILIANRPDLM
jgi:hypothetical protein